MIGITRADGSTVRVEFAHKVYKLGKKSPTRAFTLCKLVTGDKDNPTLVYSGGAYCSVEDHFVKETGRRIALFRAVNSAAENGLLTRDERGKILAAYFNRPQGNNNTTK